MPVPAVTDPRSPAESSGHRVSDSALVIVDPVKGSLSDGVSTAIARTAMSVGMSAALIVVALRARTSITGEGSVDAIDREVRTVLDHMRAQDAEVHVIVRDTLSCTQRKCARCCTGEEYRTQRCAARRQMPPSQLPPLICTLVASTSRCCPTSCTPLTPNCPAHHCALYAGFLGDENCTTLDRVLRAKSGTVRVITADRGPPLLVAGRLDSLDVVALESGSPHRCLIVCSLGIMRSP